MTSAPPLDLQTAARAALHAVAAAAIVTRAVQRHQQRGQIDKADGSPVTIADFAAQAVILRELSTRLGPVHAVGEESSAYLRRPEHQGERRAALAAAQLAWPNADDDAFLAMIDHGAATLDGDPDSDRPREFWTLDPIDGTKGFIRGHHYAVCLALIRDGVPVIGALACPNLSLDPERPIQDIDRAGAGTIFLAASGRPAEVLPADEPAATPRPLERAPRRGASGSALVFCESWESGHSDRTVTRRVMEAMASRGRRVADPIRIDSQCKYAVVARGQADVFLRRSRDPNRRDWIWDHAPGFLVASAAGVTVTDAHGRPHDYARGRTLAANHGILAAHPDHHPAVLHALLSL